MKALSLRPLPSSNKSFSRVGLEVGNIFLERRGDVGHDASEC